MATVSLCMIVKDEENNIRRCLECVSSFVDEIIILDTGSTDQTKSICLEYGAKFIEYDWNNDFAYARNQSIKEASCDWILWLDADEELIIEDYHAFQELLSVNSSSIIALKMHHLLTENPEKQKEYYISYHYRLFPNNMGIYFDGTIHEQLIFDEAITPVLPNTKAHIIHYGYQNNAVSKKRIRNLNLLLSKKKENPDDPWSDYHIAVELFQMNQLEKAFLFVNQSIAVFLSNGVVPPAIAYKLKYEMLVYSNSTQHAVEGIQKAIELYPDYVDLHFYKGLLLYMQKKFTDAIAAFQVCVLLGEENINYLILVGSGSFLAYEYMGRCYEELNQPGQAIEAYQQSLLIHPDLMRVKEKLNLLSQ